MSAVKLNPGPESCSACGAWKGKPHALACYTSAEYKAFTKHLLAISPHIITRYYEDIHA